jgi:hypothetical protein
MCTSLYLSLSLSLSLRAPEVYVVYDMHTYFHTCTLTYIHAHAFTTCTRTYTRAHAYAHERERGREREREKKRKRENARKERKEKERSHVFGCVCEYMCATCNMCVCVYTNMRFMYEFYTVLCISICTTIHVWLLYSFMYIHLYMRYVYALDTFWCKSNLHTDLEARRQRRPVDIARFLIEKTPFRILTPNVAAQGVVTNQRQTLDISHYLEGHVQQASGRSWAVGIARHALCVTFWRTRIHIQAHTFHSCVCGHFRIF